MANRRDKLDNSNPFARNPKVPTLAELTNSMLAPVPAVSAVESGNILVGNFLLTSTGMTVNGQISHDEWQQMGDILHRLDGSIQWLIGDWLVYGERVWGETYEQVAEVTARDPKTLRNYAWVARNVDLSLRRDKLTFGHHALVAALEPETQRQWLDYAEANNLSVSQLRKEMLALPPTLSESTAPEDLISREKHREFGKMLRILNKVGQGDIKAKRVALGWVIEQRRWLDEVERWLQQSD